MNSTRPFAIAAALFFLVLSVCSPLFSPTTPLLFAAAASTDPNGGCNATNSTDNETLNVAYYASYGNMTTTAREANGSTVERRVALSLCTPTEIVTHSGASCGTAYVATVGDTCDASVLYDQVDAPLTLYNTSIATLVLRSSASGGRSLTVVLHCVAGLDTVDGSWPSDEVLVLSSELSCQGYVPSSSGSRNDGDGADMLSKGAIVGIIIGVVAVVVITAAIVQWRSRSSSEDAYQAI